MHSPLPDSTALEAGILEDSPPSRLSRVQDNVRNLLRSSMLASVRSSPRTSAVIAAPDHTSVQHAPAWQTTTPQPMASPSTESIASTDSDGSESSKSSQHSTDMLIPQRSYQQAIAHHSVLFNTRAVAALDHPDLSDPSLAIMIQNEAKKRQRHAFRRHAHRRAATHRVMATWLLCVGLGLGLAALVATYVALSTTITDVSVAFHVVFVLGILFIGIAFIHTLARLLLVPHVSHHRKGGHRSRRRPARLDAPPTSNDDGTHFVPQTPIPVLIGDDNVQLDPHEAQPSAAVHQPPEVWVKDGADKAPVPPPAYGRWRGSVRADPTLLHWHAVASPIEETEPEVPFMTYEANAQTCATSPPSYKTRETPPRATRQHGQTPVEPEMVEGRGIGL